MAAYFTSDPFALDEKRSSTMLENTSPSADAFQWSDLEISATNQHK